MAGVNHLASPLGKTSILSVTIPEIKKRRVPNKFYVSYETRDMSL